MDDPRGEALFITLVAQLALAARAGLGRLGDLEEEGRGRDLAAARLQIDLLGILEEKTRGRLSPRESDMLRDTLTELRLLYVEETERGGGVETARGGAASEGHGGEDGATSKRQGKEDGAAAQGGG